MLAPRKPRTGPAVAQPFLHDVPPVGPAFEQGPDRTAMIAEAAYLRAERRHFAPGRELEDWLTAEREIDSALLRGSDAERTDS